MIRPCPTCDGSGIDYQDTCVQCERPWGPGEPCGPESYAMPKPCPCPTCVDLPRLPCPRLKGGRHPSYAPPRPEEEGTPCPRCGGRGWFKPDPETVIRWCQYHSSRWWNGSHRCIEAMYRVVHELQEDVAPCQFVWVAVPEPLEEA